MIEKFKKPLNVTSASLPKLEDYVDILTGIWSNKHLTNQGPLLKELELKLKEFLIKKYDRDISLFTNGHLALDCAIKSLQLEEGGEVITTPFTFVSTVHAIKMNNLKPIFCDIKIDNYNIDENKIEELLTEKTKAIIPVHVYGFPCNVDKIKKIADKYNLKVIYDAAHAFGVEFNNQPIGNYGDLSMFSFHATKIYNTIEGGALIYKGTEVGKTLNLLKNFGIASEEEIEIVGYNAKMSEFQAAMGLANLKNINQDIVYRKKITELYYKNLLGVEGIIFREIPDNLKYNYSYLPILIDEIQLGLKRDQLYNELKEYNIFTRRYFYPLISNTKPYKDNKNMSLRVANYVANNILCLPIYSQMQDDEVIYVCNAIKEIIDRFKKV